MKSTALKSLHRISSYSLRPHFIGEVLFSPPGYVAKRVDQLTHAHIAKEVTQYHTHSACMIGPRCFKSLDPVHHFDYPFF